MIIIICWFGAQETFIIIIKVETSCAAEYFWGKCEMYIFDEQNVQKNSFYMK